MSAENLEALRSLEATFRGGDVEAIRPILDPRVEWLAVAGLPYRCDGPDEVLETFAGVLSAGEVPSDLEYIDAGDTVVVVSRGHLHTPLGDVSEFATAFTFEDGKVVRMQDYPGKAEVLVALGLTD